MTLQNDVTIAYDRVAPELAPAPEPAHEPAEPPPTLISQVSKRASSPTWICPLQVEFSAICKIPTGFAKGRLAVIAQVGDYCINPPSSTACTWHAPLHASTRQQAGPGRPRWRCCAGGRGACVKRVCGGALARASASSHCSGGLASCDAPTAMHDANLSFWSSESTTIPMERMSCCCV
eukprot:COSAG01_NODE_170_length_23136_cov_24.853931_23_plen_178_part_00